MQTGSHHGLVPPGHIDVGRLGLPQRGGDGFGPENREAVDRAGRRAWAVLGGYVRGTAMIAAIDATLIGVGLWILDVPLAFALAVLVFLGAFIPFVGAFMSGLVAVLVAFADGGWTIALIVLGIIGIVRAFTFGREALKSTAAPAAPAAA